jgi:large subunit ribosomal protein L29
MSNVDLKNLSLDDLNLELLNSENYYHDLKYNHSISSLENSNTIISARRNVARIKTEIRKRELESYTNINRDQIIARRKRLKLIRKSK